MKNTASILVFLCVLSFSACLTSQQFITVDEVMYVQEIAQNRLPIVSTCRDFANYAPDSLHPSHTPIRYIRLNFHFINSQDSSHNFSVSEGIRYAKSLVYYANEKLRNNKKMFLPQGNKTPVLPTRYQYILAGVVGDTQDKGVYFHYDDELCVFDAKNTKSNHPQSLYSADHFEKYGVRKGEVINVFILDQKPEQLFNNQTIMDGVGTPRWVKIASPHQILKKHFIDLGSPLEQVLRFAANLLNHELGHSLGLSHTWVENDGCEDTPTHANLWTSNRPLKSPSENGMSNNVMDNNAYRAAFTPCQLGKIHYNLAREGSQERAMLAPTWCDYKAEATITIQNGADIFWNNSKDLEGDLVVETGGKLTIQCLVHLPKGAKIVVKVGGELVLDGCTLTNRCGDRWQGIAIVKKGNSTGKVVSKNKAVIKRAVYGFSL